MGYDDAASSWVFDTVQSLGIIGSVLSLSLVAACGPAAQPCTTCPDISGDYVMEAEPFQPERFPNNPTACSEVIFHGINEIATLQQKESSVDIRSQFINAHGILYDNDSITFEPENFGSSSVGAVTSRLTLMYALLQSKRSLRGNLSLDISDYDCEISSTVTLKEP